jgi:beta-glucosidase
VKRPAEELKGFQKVRLTAGEKQRISITLDSRAFAYWSEARNSWQVDSGRFDIYVGDSSENTPLTGEVSMTASSP